MPTLAPNSAVAPIGGALGNQGVISHFGNQECVFLSYHLPEPRLEPLVTPLAQHMARWLLVSGPAMQLVDGVIPAPGAGKHRQAEEIYEETRDAVVSRLQMWTPFDIRTTAELNGNALRGHVVIDGPNVDPLSGEFVVQVIIAQRGVVFHGSSGVVIHRMLARGIATPGSLNGVEYQPDQQGRFEFDFARDLAELEGENAAYLDSLRAGRTAGSSQMGLRIDPHSVELIVLVRDASSGEVAQAHQCQLDREEGPGL